MDENTSQIERTIVTEREALGRNLEALNQKARELADWRTHYRQRPWLFIGVAAGAGVIAGALVGRGEVTWPQSNRVHGEPRRPLSERSPKAAQLMTTWARVSDALLALVTAKSIDAISARVPGFRDHYDQQSDPGSRGRVASA